MLHIQEAASNLKHAAQRMKDTWNKNAEIELKQEWLNQDYALCTIMADILTTAWKDLGIPPNYFDLLRRFGVLEKAAELSNIETVHMHYVEFIEWVLAQLDEGIKCKA